MPDLPMTEMGRMFDSFRIESVGKVRSLDLSSTPAYLRSQRIGDASGLPLRHRHLVGLFVNGLPNLA